MTRIHHLGFIYSPNDSKINKWTSNTPLQDMIGLFTRVALVCDTSDNLHPLYVDAHMYPNLLPESFTVPYPWTQVSIHTEQLEDHTIQNFKVIRQTEVLPLGGMLVMPEPGSLFDGNDELLSVVNSFNGDDTDWDATTNSFSMSGVHSPTPQPTAATDLITYYDPTNTSLQHIFPAPRCLLER
ncbi:hypothetical protein AZE42_08298 [Rhizopogon vesiculosus]|uniref:Uncharacterized protein n=1 Tax=Rhizopogon vesiculosus TaxID=180088 RepID=A0A1J8Q376_9AGAM|nr:hypothetical protein AZE42_08298 [Rhizopogon vesiculosus]